MPGPPPKDPAVRRRRNATPGFKLLPHEGRQGPPPEWPLPAHPDPVIEDLELARWEHVWTLPQAIEWERMRCEFDVARYVRYAVAADIAVDPKLSTEVRQLDAKIGVSPKAMRDLRWETDEPTPDEPPVATEPVLAADSTNVAPPPRVFIP